MSQTMYLGLFQAEKVLPTESRSFVSSGNDLSSTEGRSADGSLHTDFVKNNRSFQINYSVVSEADKDLITEIYLSQIVNDTFLNFLYSDQDGNEIPATVKMSAPEFGAINPKDTFYYNGVTIDLVETAAARFSVLEQFITSDNLAFTTSDGLALVARKAF